MCCVNLSDSLRTILDNEIDVMIDDDAYLYDNDVDKCDEVSDDRLFKDDL